jgi:hypothetical protein
MAVLKFDTGAVGPNISFRNSDHQIQGAVSAWSSCRTTAPLASGKYYVEFLTPFLPSNGVIVGLMNASAVLNNYTGSNVNSCGIQPTGNVYGWAAATGMGWLTTDTVSLAFDVGAKKAWWRKNGGAWTGGGDPAAGTSPSGTWAFSGSVYVAASLFALYSTAVVNGGGNFQYAPPSGFGAIGDALSWSDDSGAQTFDPANVSALTLSGGNLIATGITDGWWTHGIGTRAPTSGQFYVEFTAGNISGTGALVGLVTPFISAARPAFGYTAGSDPHFKFWGSGGVSYGGATTGTYSFATGETVGLAWDMAAQKAWFRKKDGTWLSGDPALGTGGTSLAGMNFLGRGVTPAVSIENSPTSLTLNATGPFVLGASPWGSARGRSRRLLVVT